jgi:hypothetical protein
METNDKQKTPLMELIENMESNPNEYVSKEDYLRLIKVVLLPREREVIEEAWINGSEWGMDDDGHQAKDYFNQTFEQ